MALIKNYFTCIVMLTLWTGFYMILNSVMKELIGLFLYPLKTSRKPLVLHRLNSFLTEVTII